MRSTSTVLTFWIVVVPIFTMATLFAGVIFFYQPSFEATVIVQTLTALASVVFADLLVWERLRESLSKKLEYVHREYLAELYSSFVQGNILDFYQPTVEKNAQNLKRYGKFMGISLYPRDLPRTVSDFLASYLEFSMYWVNFAEMGKTRLKAKFNRYLWAHVLRIKIWAEARSDKNMPMLRLHQEKAKSIMEKEAKYIEKAKDYLKEAEAIRRKIRFTLEDFFKSNNLEIPEPRYDI